VVYLARQTDLDRFVALKELAAFHASDAAFAQRFLRESRVAGSLSHPNIVTVHDYFEHDGTPYIAMEYVERGSLRPFVGRMSPAQIGGVLEGLLAGLAQAEQHAIVHRDLKPENLMVTSDGRVKIADFGIAKATNQMQTGAFLTATGTTVGTPTYMAPEQAMAQEIGPWTDLYSVGCMAFEMYTGRVPFHDSDAPMAILLRHVNEPIPPVKSIDDSVDAGISDWIERLLVKDPKARTQSANEAWDDFEEITIGLLGPRWRRGARLSGRTEHLDTPKPLTPAPFEGAPPDEGEASDDFQSFAWGQPGPATPPPSDVPPGPLEPGPIDVPTGPPTPPPLEPVGESDFVTFGAPPQAEDEPPPAAEPPVRDAPVGAAAPAEPPVRDAPAGAAPAAEPPVSEAPAEAAPSGFVTFGAPPEQAPPPAEAAPGEAGPDAPPGGAGAAARAPVEPPAATPPDGIGAAAPAARAPVEPPAAAPPGGIGAAAPAARAPVEPPAAAPPGDAVGAPPDEAGGLPPVDAPTSGEPDDDVAHAPGFDTYVAPPPPRPPVNEPPAAAPPPAAEPPAATSPPAAEPAAAPPPQPGAPTPTPTPEPVAAVAADDLGDTVMPEALKRERAPAERPERPERPSRAFPIALGGALVAAIVAGVLIGGGGGEDDGGGGNQNSSTPVTPADGGAVQVKVPADYAALGSAPAIPQLELEGGAGYAPGGRDGGRAVALGATNANDSTLLPEDFRRTLGLGDGEVPERTAVELGPDGLQAYRYEGLQPEGSARQVTVYVSPTSEGVATFACLAPPADAAAFKTDCDAIANTMQVSSGRPFPVGPDKAFAKTLGATFAKLEDQVAKGREALGEKGATFRAQGAAARDIQAAYSAAAKRLRGAEVSPADQAIRAELVTRLHATAGAWNNAAAAAVKKNRRGFDRSETAIKRTQQQLRQAIAGLEAAGYELRQ
jgi:serine/threonine protein kinase